MTTRLGTTLTIMVGTCLALPGVAAADSGSITDVAKRSDGTITATYTSTSTCAGEPDRPTDCGWWPHAVEGPAHRPCYEYRGGDGRLTYVGGPGDDIWTGPNTETASDFFYPDWSPVRICLYINYGSDDRRLIAESVFPAPALPPGPGPPMSIARAKSLVPRALKEQFKRRFSRATLTRSCRRRSSDKVRCRVAWRKRRFRYRGSITLWSDQAVGYLYHPSIRRKRIG